MNASQKRAITEHRRRLGERGLARYEVRGLVQDKDLVRKLAKKLSADDAVAARFRSEVTKAVAPDSTRGGIWRALRASPLVGADLNFEREVVPPRDVDL
jgi:hypothetical protein